MRELIFLVERGGRSTLALLDDDVNGVDRVLFGINRKKLVGREERRGNLLGLISRQIIRCQLVYFLLNCLVKLPDRTLCGQFRHAHRFKDQRIFRLFNLHKHIFDDFRRVFFQPHDEAVADAHR